MRDPFTMAKPPAPGDAEDEDDADAEDPRETIRALRPRLDLDWPYPSFDPQPRRRWPVYVLIALIVASILTVVGLLLP